MLLQLEEEEEEEEEEEATGEESEDTEQYLDAENFTGIEGATPTPKRRRDAGLAASLSFGHYPEFLGMHGPSQDLQ